VAGAFTRNGVNCAIPNTQLARPLLRHQLLLPSGFVGMISALVGKADGFHGQQFHGGGVQKNPGKTTGGFNPRSAMQVALSSVVRQKASHSARWAPPVTLTTPLTSIHPDRFTQYWGGWQLGLMHGGVQRSGWSVLRWGCSTHPILQKCWDAR
jgi:hypothetical protein